MKQPVPAQVLVACTALVAAGCGAGHTSPADTTASTQASATSPPRAASPRHRADRRAARAHRSPAGLVYSTASTAVVQAQPAPGSCHALASALYSRPDPSCTPGALNPAVTQATIDKTICVSGWTETVRPPEAITEREKEASMAAYGDTGSMASYEYDHFIPLELGGATNDRRNLWPEPGASPNPKDSVEDRLREEVCDGSISLAKAQREIARNWAALAARPSRPSQSRSSARSGKAGECTVSASYSSHYHDYDLYVHSNQPDQTVIVSDAAGHSDSWHTDGGGYADVYFHTGGITSGDRITVRVGTATCSTAL